MASFSNVLQTTSASLGSHTFARPLKHPSDLLLLSLQVSKKIKLLKMD